MRQHAEDKIYSALGRLKHAKKHNPNKIIGVLGCMAQKDQKLIFERAPFVDLVVGPGQLHQVPRAVRRNRRRRVIGKGGPQLEVSLDRKAGSREEIERSFESYDPDSRSADAALRRIRRLCGFMIGCDKFCTYCIVPSVRGPEQGRHPRPHRGRSQEAGRRRLPGNHAAGQTSTATGTRTADRTTRLSDLLYRLHEIDGLERLKFVTNFPKDMTDDLLQAVRDLPKCSPYLHVPAQSGSNAVLKRMKRGYTVEEYREMMAAFARRCPMRR